jgi:hypothetical protein
MILLDSTLLYEIIGRIRSTKVGLESLDGEVRKNSYRLCNYIKGSNKPYSYDSFARSRYIVTVDFQVLYPYTRTILIKTNIISTETEENLEHYSGLASARELWTYLTTRGFEAC